jgi:hypothetical protein
MLRLEALSGQLTANMTEVRDTLTVKDSRTGIRVMYI